MSAVYVVSRITDANGAPEFETLAAFSSAEEADKQARVYKTLYNVEISELELDVHTMVPRDTVTVING